MAVKEKADATFTKTVTMESTLAVTGDSTFTGGIIANGSFNAYGGVSGLSKDPMILGAKRYSTFVASLAGTNAASVTYGDNDILVYLGPLDVSTPNDTYTPTRIVIEKITVNATTAAQNTLLYHIDAGTAASEATNAALTGRVELAGAGATQLSPEGYQLATTATEADFNGETTGAAMWASPNIQLPVATKYLYMCTTTAASATVTDGRYNILVQYFVV